MDIEVGILHITGEVDIFNHSVKNVEQRFTIVELSNTTLIEAAQRYRIDGLLDSSTGIWYPPHVIQFIRNVK